MMTCLRKLVTTLFAINFLVALAGCSTALVDERLAYWRSSTKESLPPGTPLQEAKAFFASKGIELRCCVSSPPQLMNAYFTLERNVGRSFFMEYDVVVLVILTPDQRIEEVKVQTWGVGL